MLCSNSDILQLDKEVQTSLIYVPENEEKNQLLAELQRLQEDNHILEGKIRGYTTLSKHIGVTK